MITAEEARQKVEELKNSHEEIMQKARAYIEEEIQKAIKLRETSIRLSSNGYMFPQEIWRELKELGYKLDYYDGNMYVRW